MAYATKNTLVSQINTDIADNFSEDISAKDVRDVFINMMDSLQLLGETQELVDGATINWDASAGSRAFVTLGGNRTLNAPSNVQYGQELVLMVAQDGTGSRLLTWDTFFVFDNDNAAPTLSTGANRVDVFRFLVIDDGTGAVGVQIGEVLQVWKSGWTPAPA